jgi:hypothetical protein
VFNSGVITKLANSGMISGGGASSVSGAATQGDAIYSAGRSASIGTIANSGSIVGNVVIDDQTSVGVTGGSGSTFGNWTNGVITIGNGSLTFGGGNTFLGDNVTLNSGSGKLTNMGALKVAAPLSVTGSFTQTAAGALDLDLAGVSSYGALTISSLATLDGALGIDLTGGFTLAKGDNFDILNFSNLMGNFDALALDGAACSMAGADSWSCGGGVHLNEVIGATSLDVVVAHGGSAVPEPSTWAMLALGFFGLCGLGLRKRRKADQTGLR